MCDFFSLLYAMRGFFFSAGYLFPKYFLARFFPSKSVVGYVFFSEITHTPPPKPNGHPLILFLAGPEKCEHWIWHSVSKFLKTLQVRILTNINFLPTIFICCQEKWLLELKKNDHLGENALICYQILSRLLSTSSLRKCMEISLENL